MTIRGLNIEHNLQHLSLKGHGSARGCDFPFARKSGHSELPDAVGRNEMRSLGFGVASISSSLLGGFSSGLRSSSVARPPSYRINALTNSQSVTVAVLSLECSSCSVFSDFEVKLVRCNW